MSGQAAFLPVSALLMAALGGCAAPSDYPSLAPRTVEEGSFAEPARVATPVGTPEAQAGARYASFVTRAHAADDAFRSTVEAGAAVLRAGQAAPVGSDAWGAAQQQLTRVEAARGALTEVLLALQAASDTPEVRDDSGLAVAAARALGIVAAIDAAEARAVLALAPDKS